MATYTSTQNGNWSADATWGGSGHPNTDADVANIDHEVSYDMGASTVLWGNITVGTAGKLTFPVNASSDLMFNNSGVLTVNGEMSCGTDEAPLDAAYTFRILFTRRASSAGNRLVTGTGSTAKILLYGDPDVYGSQKYGYLSADWTTGQTFYVDGDVTTRWSAGLQLYVFRNTTYVSTNTTGGIFTIASVGAYDSGNDRTPITISDAAPGVTYYSGGDVIAITRNIVIQEIGIDVAHISPGSSSSYTRTSFGQAIYLQQQKMSNCLFIGLDRAIYGGHQPHLKDSVINRCYNPVSAAYGPLIEDTDVISCYSVSSEGLYFSGKIAGCYSALTSRMHNIGLGALSILGCNYVVGSAGPGKIHARIRSCNNLFGSPYEFHVSGTIDNVNNLLSYMAEYPLRPSGIIDNAIINGVYRPLTIVSAHGDITSLNSSDTGWQTPPSGSAFILKADPDPNCSPWMVYSFQLPEPSEYMMHKFSTTGSKTITFKIYPVGWSTSCDYDDIRLVAVYASDSAGTPATVFTSTGTFANDDWRDLSVTFDLQNADVPVSFHIQFRRYESAGYWLIDPEWSVS